MQGMEAMPSCEQCPTGCDATGECIDELNGIEQGSGFDPDLPWDDVEPVRDAPIVSKSQTSSRGLHVSQYFVD